MPRGVTSCLSAPRVPSRSCPSDRHVEERGGDQIKPSSGAVPGVDRHPAAPTIAGSATRSPVHRPAAALGQDGHPPGHVASGSAGAVLVAMSSAARSAMPRTVALMFADGKDGMTEASATRSPSTA